MSHSDRTDSILDRARELPAEIGPERDLWPGIAARLGRSAAESRQPGRHWSWSVAVAAGLAVMALTATVTWRLAVMQLAVPPAEILAGLLQSDTGAALQPGPELAAVRNDLLDGLQLSLGRMPPQTQRVVIDNLLAIRTSLTAIEAALSQDPDDASLQQLLYTTYEQELQLLGSVRRMTQSLPVEVET